MVPILLSITYLCAIGFCLYTSIWLMARADQNSTTKALAVCQILVIIWCVPQLFLPFPMTRELKYGLYCISYVGICLIGPAWLTFSFLYCGSRVNRGLKCLLFGISAMDYVLLLSNSLHHLFYRSFEVEQVLYGPVFYFHMGYTYLCIFVGMAAVAREFRKRKTVRHLALILSTAAIPLGFNLLYILGVVKTGFDLTPPAFSISSFLMLVAVFRYDFLDINVLAFEHIFESIAEGVVVYNQRGVITYCNQEAGRLLKLRAGEDFSSLQETLSQAGIQIDLEGHQALENSVVTLGQEETIRVRQYIHRNKKGMVTAGTLLLTDVGEYYQLLRQNRELAVSRQQLAIEQEQNRIAQEVHDTAGHTLTMIRSLIKLIGIGLEERDGDRLTSLQWEAVEEYVKQAQNLAGEGIRQLRQAIKNMRQESGWDLVTQGIRQLALAVKEIPVEVELQGEDGPQYSHLSRVIYECLREAITNCLKYAGASRMDVIVKFAGETVSLFIFDDGQGCDSIQESDGIRGIRQRVSQAGGTLRILSTKGEGFQIYVNLPVETEPFGKAKENAHDSSGDCR